MLKTTIVLALCLSAAFLGAKEIPDWLAPLRDAVYGGNADADYVARLGSEIEDRAKQELSGMDLYNTLSYCEFLIAKAYQSEKINDEAERRFEQGFDYADSSVKDNPTSEGYRMMAENLSQLCTLRSTAWVIANGLKVERFASRGLKYDKRNGASAYLIAARWVYAPAPFDNIRKGINEMKKILSGSYDLGQDDYFNVYYAIAYAYNRSKQPSEMEPWLEKALAVYPENKDALNLKQGIARAVDVLDYSETLNAVGAE
jgi:tetratricopeptide (TPR) repeat protein